MRGFGALIVVVLVVIAVVVSIWAHFAAPCSAYKYASAKDIPGRCIMQPTNQ